MSGEASPFDRAREELAKRSEMVQAQIDQQKASEKMRARFAQSQSQLRSDMIDQELSLRAKLLGRKSQFLTKQVDNEQAQAEMAAKAKAESGRAQPLPDLRAGQIPVDPNKGGQAQMMGGPDLAASIFQAVSGGAEVQSGGGGAPAGPEAAINTNNPIAGGEMGTNFDVNPGGVVTQQTNEPLRTGTGLDLVNAAVMAFTGKPISFLTQKTKVEDFDRTIMLYNAKQQAAVNATAETRAIRSEERMEAAASRAEAGNIRSEAANRRAEEQLTLEKKRFAREQQNQALETTRQFAQDTAQKFDTAASRRKEWMQASGSFVNRREAMQTIMSLEFGKASSRAMVAAYARLIFGGGVMSDQDIRMSSASGSLPDQVVSYLNMASEGTLTPRHWADIKKTAKDVYDGAYEIQKELNDSFVQIAKDEGLPGQVILPIAPRIIGKHKEVPPGAPPGTMWLYRGRRGLDVFYNPNTNQTNTWNPDSDAPWTNAEQESQARMREE